MQKKKKKNDTNQKNLVSLNCIFLVCFNYPCKKGRTFECPKQSFRILSCFSCSCSSV